MSDSPITSWRRIMRGRDPEEPHRAATPLELLFDLCFVVAVSQAATQWHHALSEGHIGTGLLSYLMVFCAIWWAWMNFTWFASAYDTDDVPYRLLTLLQMAGVLVLAAGVPAASTSMDYTVPIIGYIVMRVAMIGQWLRAAREHPAGRSASLRYAGGIAVVQLGWVAWLAAVPQSWMVLGFVVLLVAELAVPGWAEFRGSPTSWHPEHIAERYGLFTIIVLGEVILGALTGVQSALTERGISASVLLIAAGGLILVLALWWIYFSGEQTSFGSMRIAMTWGYGHYFLFALIAAIGAGLEGAIDAVGHDSQVAQPVAALAIAVPVAGFLVLTMLLHWLTKPDTHGNRAIVLIGAVLVPVSTALTGVLGLGAEVVLIGLLAAATLAGNLIMGNRRAARSAGFA